MVKITPMTEILQIDMSGCLSIADGEGNSLTPRGQKTCGLVALVATAPKLKRARRWIQSKLWSDRGPDQASASLRQALAELRRSLGPKVHLLQADRKDVWLDVTAVNVILPGDPASTASGGEEFLSGIDIRDEAFEDWLRETRMSFSKVRSSPQVLMRSSGLSKSPIQVVIGKTATDTSEAFVNNVTASEVAKYVCERSLASTNDSISLKGGGASASTIKIICQVNCLGDRSQTHFEAVRELDDTVICSRFGEYSGAAVRLLDSSEFRQAIPEFGEQVIAKLPMLGTSNQFEEEVFDLLHAGIADIFSYEKERLTTAEAKLWAAHERTGNPSILVWLAWQKTTQVIEEVTDNKEAATELARYYCAKALEAEPHSAFANAMASLVHMIHFDDAEASFLFADRASGLSKFDPYVQAALATANMFAGKSKDAAKNSLIGSRLSRFAGNSHWWDLSHSLACLSNGDLNATEKYALRASRTSPNFRAPKRILLALYASQNRITSAVEQMHALENVEPNFEIERFLKDVDYPNTTVRNAGLLNDMAKFDLR